MPITWPAANPANISVTVPAGHAATGNYILVITNAATTTAILGPWTMSVTDSNNTSVVVPPVNITNGVMLDLSQLTFTNPNNPTITLTGPGGSVTIPASVTNTVATVSAAGAIASEGNARDATPTCLCWRIRARS